MKASTGFYCGLGNFTSLLIALLLSCVAASAADHFVSQDGSNESPFISWETAATNIQDAIDVAVASETVWVTNGTYATGGKVIAGDLTNRIALDKALTVRSINGPAATIIQGFRTSSGVGSGPDAVRGAWVGAGAVLNGFTIQLGGTRSSGDSTLTTGGGVFCASTTATLTNCVITTCHAAGLGGGAYSGTINNCTITSCSAANGAGAYSSTINSSKLMNNRAPGPGGGAYGGALKNCSISGNSASSGGGCYSSTLNNCTVTGNLATSGGGGGINGGVVTNCIIWNNNISPFVSGPNYSGPISLMTYACTSPLPTGTGNITNDPVLVDPAHISVTSPCRGKGSSLYTSGTDIDGESWVNPPSMGCDEIYDAALVGSLMPDISPRGGEAVTNRSVTLNANVVGRVSRLDWSFGDGASVTNSSYQVSHAWTNEGSYNIGLTAYNTDYPVGVTSNFFLHAGPIVSPTITITRTSGIALNFPTQLGVNYFIDYSANISTSITWGFFSFAPGNGTFQQITDTPSLPSRFYRLHFQ